MAKNLKALLKIFTLQRHDVLEAQNGILYALNNEVSRTSKTPVNAREEARKIRNYIIGGDAAGLEDIEIEILQKLALSWGNIEQSITAIKLFLRQYKNAPYPSDIGFEILEIRRAEALVKTRYKNDKDSNFKEFPADNDLHIFLDKEYYDVLSGNELIDKWLRRTGDYKDFEERDRDLIQIIINSYNNPENIKLTTYNVTDFVGNIDMKTIIDAAFFGGGDEKIGKSRLVSLLNSVEENKRRTITQNLVNKIAEFVPATVDTIYYLNLVELITKTITIKIYGDGKGTGNVRNFVYGDGFYGVHPYKNEWSEEDKDEWEGEYEEIEVIRPNNIWYVDFSFSTNYWKYEDGGWKKFYDESGDYLEKKGWNLIERFGKWKSTRFDSPNLPSEEEFNRYSFAEPSTYSKQVYAYDDTTIINDSSNGNDGNENGGHPPATQKDNFRTIEETIDIIIAKGWTPIPSGFYTPLIRSFLLSYNNPNDVPILQENISDFFDTTTFFNRFLISPINGGAGVVGNPGTTLSRMITIMRVYTRWE